MWKRLAVLVSALALVAAACGGDDESTVTTPAPPDPAVTTTGAPATPTRVGQGPGTLAAVQARGVLRCGVSGSLVGFSETQPDGNQLGFDADFCRAVAAAVLGDATKVEFRPLTAAERFDVLKAGDVDVLFRNTTVHADQGRERWQRHRLRPDDVLRWTGTHGSQRQAG